MGAQVASHSLNTNPKAPHETFGDFLTAFLALQSPYTPLKIFDTFRKAMNRLMMAVAMIDKFSEKFLEFSCSFFFHQMLVPFLPPMTGVV